jgi:predicted RNA-binding Zn ribbon-like protein
VAAHYAVVEKLVLPARLSGHASLDFCNTWAGWDGHATRDYLEDYGHLAVFAGFVGVLPEDRVASLRRQARRRARESASALERARRFRAALYDTVRNGAASPSWDLVAREVEAAAAARRLHRANEGIRWEIEPGAGLAAPMLAMAWSAGELLTSRDLAYVRACPGAGCGWLFLDPRGRRRWCTMATCGNREKARRFAARERTKRSRP